MAAILFDKSAFEAHRPEAHGTWLFAFQENIAPILLLELMGDLSASPDDPAKAMTRVQRLAEKFNGSGGTINVDWRLPCAGSLTGNYEPPMNGQILVGEWDVYEGIEANGERSMLMEPTQGNIDILRWARAEFRADEHAAADLFRKRSQAFTIESLIGRLKASNVPTVNALQKIPSAVDAVLADASMQATLIDWLIDQLRGAGYVLRVTGSVARIRAEAKTRWNAAGRPLLKDFASYAHHCARALLMLIVGDKVLTKRPTNRLDVEYLLYLPFCHVFVSNDGLHAQLAPLLMRPDQRTMRSDKLMQDPARVASEAESRVDFSRDRPWG